jgi:hypothetical protein
MFRRAHVVFGTLALMGAACGDPISNFVSRAATVRLVNDTDTPLSLANRGSSAMALCRRSSRRRRLIIGAVLTTDWTNDECRRGVGTLGSMSPHDCHRARRSARREICEDSTLGSGSTFSFTLPVAFAEL